MAMTSRTHRRSRILQIISTEMIPNQHTLQAHLAREGIATTQATLSRDLRELGILKSREGYITAERAASVRSLNEPALERSLERGVGHVDIAAAVVVLRTEPGYADAVASEIDRAREAEVVGTIAGDDTIFVAVRHAEHARMIADRYRRLARHVAGGGGRS